jgi:type VI secretion system protein ImpF
LPLLDRLIDDAPGTSVEAPPSMGDPAIGRRIRESIVRDLEVLLNTRQRLVQPPWAGPKPSASIIDFGLPPARGTNLATAAGRKEFSRAIEAAIGCFEPRLRDVRVAIESGETPLDPLRMVIDAKLATPAGLAGEPLQFAAAWAAGQGRIRVEEGRV